ncbi:MAG: PadR family transcriptional regulator [Thermoplasmata archaeon]|jgi:DNA-binding PadR family transcriptional regulator
MAPSDRSAGRRTGFLGIYTLSLLQREALCGAQISKRIRERTKGAWSVSPGAMYPVLQDLLHQGYCERYRRGREWVYSLTPLGHRRLRLSRRRSDKWRERFQNIGPLLLDMQRPEARARFVRDRAEQIVGWALETLDQDELWPDRTERQQTRRALAAYLLRKARELRTTRSP